MMVTTGKVISPRWLARSAFALVLAAADMIGFADLAMVAVGAAGACLMLAGGYWFLIFGMTVITVSSARQAASLLCGRPAAGLSALTAKKIEITADAAEIPAGVDGEAVPLPPPVACPISPGVRHAWVPRDRPSVSAPKPSVNRPGLRHLADARSERAGDDTTAVSTSSEPALAWRISSIWYPVRVDR